MSQIEISQLPPPEVVKLLDARFIRERMLKRYAELSQVSVPKVGDPIYNAFSSMSEEVTRLDKSFKISRSRTWLPMRPNQPTATRRLATS